MAFLLSEFKGKKQGKGRDGNFHFGRNNMSAYPMKTMMFLQINKCKDIFKE